MHLPPPSLSSPGYRAQLFPHLFMEVCSAHSLAPRLLQGSPLLPNTPTEPEQGREGCVYVEVIRILSFTAVSLPIFLPAYSVPLWRLLQGLCFKCVPDGSTTGLFSFKASTHMVSARSLAPQGPSWWLQINARDIFHHPEPVLTSTSDPGIDPLPISYGSPRLVGPSSHL